MAKSKAHSITDSIKALKAGKAVPAPKIENVKTGKDIKPPTKPPKNKDKRSGNGGAREGAGRKPGGTALQRRLVRTLVQDHYTQEVDVKVKDPKTGNEHTIKKPRVLVAIDTLFQVGVQNKDAHALDRYLNRALGKPPQPLIGDEEEDPVRIDLGVERILGKAYGDDEE